MPVAARTLVKSPPELWSEISEPDALARHLGAFGEIRITRLEPESTVAWEGTRARGTVELEPAGWGTKVTVTAEEVEAQDAPATPSDDDDASASPRTTATAAEPDPAPQRVLPEPATEPRGDAGSDVASPTRSAPPAPRGGGVRGLFARLRRRREEVAAERAPEPEPAATEPEPGSAQAEPLPIADQPTIELPAAHAVPEVEPAVEDHRAPAEVLDDMLASLGSARHRPFSRG